MDVDKGSAPDGDVKGEERGPQEMKHGDDEVRRDVDWMTETWKGCLEGRSDAWASVYSVIEQCLRKLGLNEHDVKELAQELVLRLYRRESLHSLEHPSALFSFCRRSATNIANDYWRKQARRAEREQRSFSNEESPLVERVADESLRPDLLHERACEEDEENKTSARRLRALTLLDMAVTDALRVWSDEKCGPILTLKFGGDPQVRTNIDIARAVGYSESGINKRIQRCLRKFVKIDVVRRALDQVIACA